MNLLALDTSTERLCLALWAGERVWTHEEEGGAQASARLLPSIMALLERAQLRLQDLQGLACGIGPGAFTGLRTACSVIQGLALGLDLPVVGVPSLMIVAEDARRQSADPLKERVVQVWVDARMAQLYAGTYRWSGGRWTELAAPVVLDVASVTPPAGLDPHTLWAGSGVPLVLAGAPVGTAADGACVRTEQDRALALAHCARQRWRDGPPVDAALLVPAYVRDKVAQTTAEREAAALAAPSVTHQAGA